MIFISFGANAKESIFDCNPEWKIKVEEMTSGPNKLFFRHEGLWERTCTENDSIITEDSFRCIGGVYWTHYVFDRLFKTLTHYAKDGRKEILKCEQIK